MKKTSLKVLEALTVIALSCHCLTGSAKTIALWPIEWDEAKQCRDGHCAVDPANDLSFDSDLVYTNMTDGWGWTLPPNPDPDYPVENTSALHSQGTATAKNYAYSTSVGKYLTADRDFTLEGWFRFPTLPQSTFFVADCGGVNNDGNRWFLTFRPPNSDEGTTHYNWQIYFQPLNTGNVILYMLSTAEEAEITKGWHHWAVVFRHSTDAGTACFEFYQDGQRLGVVEKSAYSGTVSGDRFFGLGCRNNLGNVFTGSIDYCRLSDCALEPSQFLCGAKDSEPPKTRAFWKLDKAADGGVNGAPSVGNARLYGGYYTYPPGWSGGAAYNTSQMRPDLDCAFPSNPPNPTVTLPNGNSGSMFACVEDRSTRLPIKGIGTLLSFATNFTVEGWIKICRQTDSDVNTNFHHVCGTRLTVGAGWCLQYCGGRGEAELRIYARGVDGRVVDGTLASLADCEDRWIHLALAYDHADGGGKGVWRAYVDGMLKGSVTNGVKLTDNSSACPDFCFGGMRSDLAEPYCIVGKLDCWRVARTALRPTQLMCAREGAEAATDVVALWPLNVQNGAWLDGTDIVGAYTFESPRTSDYLVTGTADAPDVPGFSSPTNGSALFNSGTSGSRSTLLCMSEGLNALYGTKNRDGWTMEWYVKRTSEATANEFLFFATTPSTRLDTSPTGHLNLQYRNTGFWLNVKGVVVADTQFQDAKGDGVTLPVGEWKHVALVQVPPVSYELYVDGVRRAVISGTAHMPETPQALQFGGRANSENSWRGAISSIRISSGVLKPTDFLCAKTNVRETVAYWPLEFAGGKLDLAARPVDPSLALVASNTVAGSGSRASAYIPGLSELVPNVGSVVLSADGCAETQSVGERVDLTVPFTVEGWLKCSQVSPRRATIAGSYTGNGGWRLQLDTTGVRPTVRIYAKGNGQRCVIVDDVLLDDATALLKGWHHLALFYDPVPGNGVWSLMVDRCPVGKSVVNAERPVVDFASQSAFRLGADDSASTCAGGYDLWRVSSCLLNQAELLAPKKQGLVLFVQ